MSLDEYEVRKERFAAILGDRELAGRLMQAISAYHQRSLWRFQDIADSVEHDILRGKTFAEVLHWMANLV